MMHRWTSFLLICLPIIGVNGIGRFNHSEIVVSLIGDSLIVNALTNYDLLNKIQTFLLDNNVKYNIRFENYAVNAKKISDIKNEQLSGALSIQPDVV